MQRHFFFLTEGLGNSSGLIHPLFCVRKGTEGGREGHKCNALRNITVVHSGRIELWSDCRTTYKQATILGFKHEGGCALTL